MCLCVFDAQEDADRGEISESTVKIAQKMEQKLTKIRQQVRTRLFFSHALYYIQHRIILPRQARAKHRSGKLTPKQTRVFISHQHSLQDEKEAESPSDKQYLQKRRMSLEGSGMDLMTDSMTSMLGANS